MPLTSAIGTSLVAVAALGLTTASSYALSGYVDWTVAGLLVAGGVIGGIGGIRWGKALSSSKRVLDVGFAGVVIAVGIYVVLKGAGAA